MRVYFTHILESDLEDYKQGCTICDIGHMNPYSGKGERRTMTVVNVKTGNRREVKKVIGLGYKDFKDREDYEKRAFDVIKQKFLEVGLKEDGSE